MNIIQTLITAGLGGVLWFCADRVIYWLLQQYNPIAWLEDFATTVNENLERMKAKYPEAGKLLEQQVITGLNKAVDIISK